MSVPGLERGIAILRLFRRERPYLSAPQIAAELAIPRSTVHRLLTALGDLDLIRRTDDGRIALSSGVLTLGHECLMSLDVVGAADLVLASLRDEIGWSTHLAVRHGRSVTYLVRHASRAAVTTNITVGMSLPAHATLMGRALLAELERDELRSLYESSELTPHSSQTPRTLQELERMLAADRERGFVASCGYYETGVAAIAAPVRDVSRRIVAAINATAPARTPAATDQDRVVTAVIKAAGEISERLGAPIASGAGTRPLPVTGAASWL